MLGGFPARLRAIFTRSFPNPSSSYDQDLEAVQGKQNQES